MSITPHNIWPAACVCIGAGLYFFSDWRTLGLVLMLGPVVLGMLATLWLLLKGTLLKDRDK